MKKGKRIVCSILCLVLLCALTLPARAEAPEVNIVWLPEGVTPVNAGMWSIKGNTGSGYMMVDSVLSPRREAKKGDLVAVKRDGIYGYMNLDGELVVPFTSSGTYLNEEWYFFYSDGLLPVLQRDENGQISTRYVDKTGETVIELEEGFAGFAFQDGVALVMGHDSWGEGKIGAIDTKGNVVVPYEYDDLNDSYGLGFTNGFVILGKENAQGETDFFFVSADGKTVIPLSDYEDARPFSEGLAAVKQDGKWGYIDSTGMLKIPCTYGSTKDFQNGFAAVYKDGKYGYINTAGKEITPMEFDSADSFTADGVVSVITSGDRYYIDKTGNRTDYTSPSAVPQTVSDKLTAEGYEVIAPIMIEQRIVVAKDGKMGYVDQNGDIVIPMEYDWDAGTMMALATVNTLAWRFRSGLALANKEGKWGFINTQGEVVVPFEMEEFDRLGLLMGGYVGVVYKDGRYGIFENPYYKEPSTPSSPGLLSGGGSGSSASAGGGSFPILPVAAVAVVAAAGGALLILKKKKS